MGFMCTSSSMVDILSTCKVGVSLPLLTFSCCDHPTYYTAELEIPEELVYYSLVCIVFVSCTLVLFVKFTF
jgi:hypothetical protein